jgi:hypothetical protein
MPRQDTRLEAEGAEFLVLSQLLLHRIEAYKAYTNMPGYDLVATNPETGRLARIQVKSRWKNADPHILIRNLDKCDFVVAVRLNLDKKSGGECLKTPECFVLGVDVARTLLRDSQTSWPKIYFKHISDEHKDNWPLIAEALFGGREPSRCKIDRAAARPPEVIAALSKSPNPEIP